MQQTYPGSVTLSRIKILKNEKSDKNPSSDLAQKPTASPK